MAYDLPLLPRLLTASCHSRYFKIRSATPETQIVQPLRHSTQPAYSNPFTCLAFGAVVAGWCVSLLFKTNETQAPRLRNFDTDPPSSYYYEFSFDNRLESVANAHTAADLHVRPDPQTALVSRAVGAANVLRDTSCPVSRNENDSTPVPVKTTSVRQIRQRLFAQSSKVLNLCTDSKCRAAVTFLAIAQNKFIKCLLWRAAERNFRTTAPRYADK
jgi:hypothetical protein